MITVARPVPDLSGFFKLLHRYMVMGYPDASKACQSCPPGLNYNYKTYRIHLECPTGYYAEWCMCVVWRARTGQSKGYAREERQCLIIESARLCSLGVCLTLLLLYKKVSFTTYKHLNNAIIVNKIRPILTRMALEISSRVSCRAGAFKSVPRSLMTRHIPVYIY